MRSIRGLVAAATILLSYLAAIAVELLFGSGGDTVIHLAMGTGFVIFATSVFDFGLPRWVNIIGATAAGAFGAIFLLQGVSDLTHLEGLRYVAFDVLGHRVERLLPDVVYLWFVALLLGASQGKSRILGWAVMLTVVGLEIASPISLLLGSSMQGVPPIVVVLLPFVWLLFESAKRQPTRSIAPRAEAAAAGASTRRVTN
jgi:hypothetical protein